MVFFGETKILSFSDPSWHSCNTGLGQCFLVADQKTGEYRCFPSEGTADGLWNRKGTCIAKVNSLSLYTYNYIHAFVYKFANDCKGHSHSSRLTWYWTEVRLNFTQSCKLPIWFGRGQHGEFGPRGAGSDELKLEACWWFNHKCGKVNKCSLFTLPANT